MYRLMIVDDDELIRKGLEKVIQWEELGYQVEGVFGSGAEALKFLEHTSVDVVLTDIRMPEITGLELIEQAKTLHPQIKAVIISGYGEFELARKALLLKVEAYLLKPLGQKEIEEVFLKLKKGMDAESRQQEADREPQSTWEYELVKLLEARAEFETLFQKNSGNGYFELILLKVVSKHTEAEQEQWNRCRSQVKGVLDKTVYSNIGKCFAALLVPGRFDEILMAFRKLFFDMPYFSYQLFVGREIFSREDVLASYWAVLDVMKGTSNHGVFHCEKERNLYRRDWDKLQQLTEDLIRCMEDGKYYDMSVLAERIFQVVKDYDEKTSYHFFNRIVERIAKYFEVDTSQLIYSHDRFDSYEPMGMKDEKRGQMFLDFKQDLESIRKWLHENSDSMRNIIVNKAKGIIVEDFADGNLSLASLANRLGVSYGYLSTIFTKSTGKSFKTYLVDIRMEKARSLLLSRKYKIYEIAQLVGYNNSRYFTDAFRKYFKCSPAEYITKFRGER